MALSVKTTLKSKICLDTVANGGPRFTAKVDICRQFDDLVREGFCAAIHQLRQARQLCSRADLEFIFAVVVPCDVGRFAIPCISGIQRYAQQGILLDIIDVAVIGIFFICNYLIILGVALGVPAGVGVSLVRVALDDGRAAAVHHLRGKRRGGHQRQRERHAHQQAHHAPGHVACPFLHVICSSHC